MAPDAASTPTHRWLAGGHRYKSICYSDMAAVSGQEGQGILGHFNGNNASALVGPLVFNKVLLLCDEVIVSLRS